MGQRLHAKAETLVRRANRRRLRLMLRKHPDLGQSPESMLIMTAIWHQRGMLRWLLEQGVSPNMGCGNTPLMSTAAEGDVWAMRQLLEFGADPNLLNDRSENALGFAVTWQQPEAIKLLIHAGVDINNQDDSGPDMTQLDSAELSGWHDMAAVLRSLGGLRFVELSNRALPH